MEPLRQLARFAVAFLAVSAALTAVGPDAFGVRLIPPDPGSTYSPGGIPSLAHQGHGPGMAAWGIALITLAGATAMVVVVAIMLGLRLRCRPLSVMTRQWQTTGTGHISPTPAEQCDPYAVCIDDLVPPHPRGAYVAHDQQPETGG